VLFVVAACGQSDGENSGDSAQAQPSEPAEQAAEENADAGASDASSSDAGGGEPAEDAQDAASVGQEEYVRKANAICGDATEAIDALPEPGSLLELADSVPDLLLIAQTELASLRALEPPTDEAEQLDPTLFEILDRQIGLLGDLGEAAAADDIVRTQEVVVRASALSAQGSAIATAYGLIECSDTVDSSLETGADEGAAEEPQTPEAMFIAAADEVCRDSLDRVSHLREPQSVEESVDVFAQVVEISTEELARLGELEAPAEISARYDELLALLAEQIEMLASLRDALLEDDREAAGQALLENSRLNAEADLIEQELGFAVCGTEPVQDVPNQLRPPQNS
jgi:hypothetical protein